MTDKHSRLRFLMTDKVMARLHIAVRIHEAAQRRKRQNPRKKRRKPRKKRCVVAGGGGRRRSSRRRGAGGGRPPPAAAAPAAAAFFVRSLAFFWRASLDCFSWKLGSSAKLLFRKFGSTSCGSTKLLLNCKISSIEFEFNN